MRTHYVLPRKRDACDDQRGAQMSTLWSETNVRQIDHKQQLYTTTVVPVMNGHPRDQAKVSLHDTEVASSQRDGWAGGRHI